MLVRRLPVPAASTIEVLTGDDGSVHLILLNEQGSAMAGIHLCCEAAFNLAEIVGVHVDDFMDDFEQSGGDTIGECAGSA